MNTIKPRIWLIKAREKRGLDRQQLGKLCDCSEELIYGLEQLQWITHPQIAVRIAHVLRLRVKQYEHLVDERHHTGKLPEIEYPQDVPDGCSYFRDYLKNV